jgi:glycosyltransferase involved in cell wall biosynthesis
MAAPPKVFALRRCSGSGATGSEGASIAGITTIERGAVSGLQLSALVNVAEGEATDLARTLGPGLSRKTHLAPHPVNLEAIELASREPPAAELAGIPQPWIVACGRLVEAKAFDTLIRAFPKVRSETESPPSLIIMGEGALRRDLEELARSVGVAPRTFLPGFVPNQFSVMRRAAVFVLSSRREGCPNVLLQALACGATVVATDCQSGPREIIRNEREGTLVPVDSPDALAAAITNKLAHPNDPQVVRARMQAFAANRVARQLLATIDSVFTHDRAPARRPLMNQLLWTFGGLPAATLVPALIAVRSSSASRRAFASIKRGIRHLRGAAT